MSNKTQLQTNNTNLDALITRVNAAKDTAASLPEAGGGGNNVETYSGTFTSDGPGGIEMLSGVQAYYTDGDLNLQTIEIGGDITSLTAAKGTLVCIKGSSSSAVSGCSRIGGGVGVYVYEITSNFAISIL